MLTGLGMTETAPSCTFAVGDDIALWRNRTTGARCRGEAGADGRQDRGALSRARTSCPATGARPSETAAAFDEEGYYRTGDAVAFKDPVQPQHGLRFDGRIAEDFKLSTGTFVSVGPLRMRDRAAGDPLVQDVVLTGINRDEVGALVFPRVEDARSAGRLPRRGQRRRGAAPTPRCALLPAADRSLVGPRHRQRDARRARLAA